MTITFPDKACAVTYTWKAYVFVKRLFENIKGIKDICYGINWLS